MNIIKFLSCGKANAVTRQDLVKLSGLNDRELRNQIEAARRSGIPIANDQDGNGYYICDSLPELKNQFRRNYNRAVSILSQQIHLRRKIDELEKNLHRFSTSSPLR